MCFVVVAPVRWAAEVAAAMHVFLMIQCHKTTIFTNIKESSMVFNLMHIVKGIVKWPPHKQRLCKDEQLLDESKTLVSVALPVNSFATGPNHCGAGLSGRWGIWGPAYQALFQPARAACCFEGTGLRKQCQWTSPSERRHEAYNPYPVHHSFIQCSIHPHPPKEIWVQKECALF